MKEITKMSKKDEEMEKMIKDAKKQILAWYNPETDREFIESSTWSASPQYGEGSGSLTKLFVLQGGEAKGTILADYFNRVVIAYDRTFNEFRIWRATK
jgi:hypothetical protein